LPRAMFILFLSMSAERKPLEMVARPLTFIDID
jgi:hypothetical protein